MHTYRGYIPLTTDSNASLCLWCFKYQQRGCKSLHVPFNEVCSYHIDTGEKEIWKVWKYSLRLRPTKNNAIILTKCQEWGWKHPPADLLKVQSRNGPWPNCLLTWLEMAT